MSEFVGWLVASACDSPYHQAFPFYDKTRIFTRRCFFFFSFLFLSLSLSLCFFFAHNRRGDQVPVGRGQRQPAGGSLRVRNRQAAADHGHHKRQHWDRRERVVQRPDDRGCDVRRHQRLGHEQRDGWVLLLNLLELRHEWNHYPKHI